MEKIDQRMRQKWDCSQIEDSVEEGDVMDWHEHDEMKKQWADVSKEEVKIVQRKTEGSGLQIEGVQSVPKSQRKMRDNLCLPLNSNSSSLMEMSYCERQRL